MRETLTLLLVIPFFAATAQQTVSNDSLAKELASVKNDVASLKNLKVTGWLQAQFQVAESRGAANFDGGNFSPNADTRFMIRRGRIKFTYNAKNSQLVLQINATERGINLTEFFGVLADPWTKTFSLTVGVMNRPFGFEIDQSSVVRESPERSRYSQILMPNERDLGVKISYAPATGSRFHGLRVDAGFYNGQGVYVPGTGTPPGYPAGTAPGLGVNEFDFQKDFIGRLCYYRTLPDNKITFGLGMSHYNGGNMYQSNEVYRSNGVNDVGYKDWQAADSAVTQYKNKTAPRIYYGAEAFFSFVTGLGKTTLRGEYVSGTQSAQINNTSSPFYLPASKATYIRQFEGAYMYFIERVADKHELVFKYEWYDPNTAVTGSDIQGLGKSSYTAADLKYTQMGMGYNFLYNDHIKFMFHYNIVTNEKVSAGAGGPLEPYTADLKDNIFTARFQYRF